jgi:hypothetical protein
MKNENEFPPPKKKCKVKLIGQDGNAFNLMGICQREMKKDKQYTSEMIKQFQKEAMSSDYDNLLATCAKWCDVC